MATKINPPDLSSGNYELYKEKLLAWQMVTDIPVDKQGIVIALTLPNDDKHKIQEEVFSQIGREKLSQENGLDTLINFLDSKLMKDDLSDSLEKFEEFEDFQRVNGQNITEYIAAFDSRYRKMEKFKIKLPSEILAFKLLRRANISKEEKMLVLTGMNYANRETLYEEAKQSLKKFKGDITEGSKSTAASVKLEPAFLAENEEALLAAGYYKQGQGKRSVRTGRGGYSRGGGQRGQGQEARRKMNPTGPDGKPLTCRVCGSYRHLMKDCPDSWENIKKVNIVEDENVVLFTGYNKEEIYQLGVDARNCAILDSACSSTVCGQNWMDSYINSLNEVDRKKIKQTTGERTFKFGGGTRLKSRAEYCLPAVIAGKEVTIKTDVVGSDIPLLLSRTAMKRAGVKMDLENDSATIFGKDIALNLTTSGHYCIPIDRTENIAVEEVFSVKLEEMGRQDKVKTLLKLHRQFAHPRPRKLKSLLQDADIWRDDYQDLLEEIDRKCELCKRYSKTPARPVVGMPMATQFNEKVAMDLKQWKGRWILHIIDMWSRYTISVFINRKRPSEVINALMQNWVGVFGVMGSILTDNGGEFNADEMREVMSILNVRVLTTAAESPFQNGLCERVHAVTDMMLLKLEEENKRTDSQTLLCWANMARNALQMWNGYSSHQLIFGKNPNLPGIMTDGLPGLEGSTSSEIFAKHLNALHSSRRAYIETEANERIRRALRGKIRAAEDIFEKGDTVYYKREGKERWLGPATVVFQEGKVVFVRHGGIFVRVSPNRIERVNEILERHESGDAVQTEHKEGVVETNEEETEEESPVSEVIAAPVPAEDQNYEAPDRNSENQLSVTDQELQTVSSETATGSVENDRDTDRNTERSTRVKVNDNIRYKLGDEWVNGTIISRAGKASGKYKNWYNVRNENNDERSIDLERHEWQKIPETEINITETSSNKSLDSSEINIAKENELEKLAQFETYEEVADCGQKVLSTRWVITNKDGKTKARLVVRGFEERDLEIPRDSPTVGKGTMRLFISIAALENWAVKTTDIKSAFLQGKELERDIYIRPPKESQTPQGLIWKLKHGLYGLKDGARQFYESVREELMKLGFTQCRLDPALFYVHKDNRLRGIICCHVDDFLHAGDELFEALMEKLRGRFSAGKVEEKEFRYIGFKVKQYENRVILDHSEYIERMKNETVDPKRATDKKEILTTQEQKLYRQLVGQLNWAVQGSRPDMAFEMINMSTKLKQGTVENLVRVIKKISRMKDFHSYMTFPRLNKAAELKIVVFTDASLGNINEGTGSTGAYIVWLMDNTGQCCPIAWNAHKIKRVVRSTLAAETLGLEEGLEASYYYREMLASILGVKPRTVMIEAYVDNKSIIEAILSTRLVEDKRLRVDVAAIKESLQLHDVKKIQWVPGHLQLANPMTKQGASGFNLLKVLQSGKMLDELC